MSDTKEGQESESVSRRDFLKRVAVAGTAAGGGLALGETFSPVVSAPPVSTDVQSASYVVYIDSSTNPPTVKARNGTTGAIDFSGTSAATVIQSAWNQVMANTGRLYIRSGTYLLGTTSLVATDPSSIWEMVFEPGAKLTYSGTDFALKLNATTRGNVKQFNLVNVNIESSGSQGGCIQSKGGYLFEMRNLRLRNTGSGPVTCLDLDNLNSGYVTGGWFQGPWTPSTPIVNSVGLRFANGVGDTNLVRVFSPLISGCEKAVQLGTSPVESSKPAIGISLLGAEIASNKYGVYGFVGNRIGIEHCWFENQAADSIVVDNNGLGNTPSGWDVNYNTFSEGATINNLRVTGYLYYLRALGNSWGSGKVVLTANTSFAELDLATVIANQLTMGGAVPASLLLNRSVGVMTKAGAPVDGDFTNPQDGLLVVDKTNNRIYVRTQGTWKSVALA